MACEIQTHYNTVIDEDLEAQEKELNVRRKSGGRRKDGFAYFTPGLQLCWPAQQLLVCVASGYHAGEPSYRSFPSL